MKTVVKILSENEQDLVHEQTLKLLAETGLRVDTSRGRQILREAGAIVDESTRRVLFPRNLVEASLQSAPKEFVLGGRRPGWSLALNAGQCTLQADGGAIYTIDSVTGERRPATPEDWLIATLLTDALDDFGVYWSVVEPGLGDTPGEVVAYWRKVFRNFSKHVQDSTANEKQSCWMLEVLQTIFGDKDTIRRSLPLSFLLCPHSPLVIEETYTNAYLETIGWGIPVAVMPMPLMGATGPGSLISTLLLSNCETLAVLCLVQAAAPGTPFIYAGVPAIANPHSGRFGGGEVEHALLSAAVTEMARYYRLPVEASAGGSDHHIPSIQAGYEGALNWTLPALAWPDILVGPGSLGGSMIFSPEQLLIDVEIFRRCKRLRRGIECSEDKWLENVIAKVGPAGNFLSLPSTRDGLRAGELYLSKLGVHKPYEGWQAAGKPDLLEEVRLNITKILTTHRPLPFDEAVESELDQIESHAHGVS